MKRYSVKKGKHDFTPRNWWPFHSGLTSKEYRVRFNGTNLYEPIDWENDYNKGGGWSYGFDVHKDSIRWCWRPSAEPFKIELCLYLYEAGLRKISGNMVLIPINQDVFIRLKYNGAIASIHVREFDTGIENVIAMPWTVNIKTGLLNDLYFGGNNPAGQNMYIDLQK